MFKKIVIASHNQGKVKEIGELLASLGLTVISAGELNVNEPEETGDSFAENALLKAQNTLDKTGLPALADDSGIVIPALDGAPGIYSARWAAGDKSFATAFARIEKELTAKGFDADGMDAYFICVLCLALPEGEPQLFEGRIDGKLTLPPRGTNGFGYDPIFTPEGHNITFGEMAFAEKHAMSHRARAFTKFLSYLEKQP